LTVPGPPPLRVAIPRLQASRFPDSVYPSVKLLLGHSDRDTQSQIYSEIYRTPLQVDAATQQVVYTASEAAAGMLRYPEEALAMQLSHAKKLAKAAAGGESILDVVVIVR
jgi:molecular chaperone DnaK (HSP70)